MVRWLRSGALTIVHYLLLLLLLLVLLELLSLLVLWNISVRLLLLIVGFFILFRISFRSRNHIKFSPQIVLLCLLLFCQVSLLVWVDFSAVSLGVGALTLSLLTDLTQVPAHMSASLAVNLLQVKTETLVRLARSILKVPIRGFSMNSHLLGRQALRLQVIEYNLMLLLS